MKHFTITFGPDEKKISIHAGATILEAAGQAGIILDTICGGEGICEKCLVSIGPGAEQVLACQYEIHSDLTVTVPEKSRFFEQKILTSTAHAKVTFEPDIYKKYEQIAAGKILGVALDVGTTTVVANLVDMTTGHTLATAAAINPQVKFGDDVISRITYADTDEKLGEMHDIIITCINKLLDELCMKGLVTCEEIFEVCVVGNTTMNHIFLKLPIKQLGQAPYHAYSLDAHENTPEELGLRINPGGSIHTVENIAGFVGADTTAVALAADIGSASEMTLAIDIGTNGELVLGTKEKLYAASCAAGPALEGARIFQGSRAMAGAIEAVVLNKDDIDVDVIGNCQARSICGSGLIDAVAVLLELGILDLSGRFVSAEKLRRLPPAVFSRLIRRNGQPAFTLAPNVVLTQRDIRQAQLAKAAIRAGIRLLQKKIGINDDDIKQIFIAGAFGNYIRKQSAQRIGLLPEVGLERIASIGNAAAEGAKITLLSHKARALSKELAGKIEYMEIAHQKDFTDIFTNEILFR